MCHSIFWLAYPPPGVPRVGPEWFVKTPPLGTHDPVNAPRVGSEHSSEKPKGWGISLSENPTVGNFTQ